MDDGHIWSCCDKIVSPEKGVLLMCKVLAARRCIGKKPSMTFLGISRSAVVHYLLTIYSVYIYIYVCVCVCCINCICRCMSYLHLYFI